MFNIITDSTAYFTREEAERLNIFVVPMAFTVNDKKYAEGYSGEQNAHLSEIENSPESCKTSQPNLKLISDAMRHALKDGKNALMITVSSRLSGAYNSALLAASEWGDRVTVFDSLSIAGGEKLLCQRAAQLKESGADIGQAVSALEEYRSKIHVLFSVSDMDALRRSGRIGLVKQSISNILNIVPLLRIKDGAVESVINARGLYNFFKKINEFIPQNLQSAIIMAFEEEKLRAMQEYLNKNYPDLKELNILKPGAVLAIHLGLKSFGMAWVEE